nr:tetratricopeptide repeat protein [Planctomycetota bacterium]
MVHPLQTEGVTYVIQRAQSMMAMFQMVALYAVARSHASRARLVWQAIAVLCLAMALDCKPHLVAMPLVVLLYERIFQGGPWSAWLRRGWPLYAGMGWLWLFNVGHMASLFHTMDIGSHGALPVAGGSQTMTSTEYAQSEFAVIIHYLRLSVWLSGLCLDYAWPIAQSAADIVPYALVVVTMMAAGAWALWRFPAVGFLVAWVALNLAPSSSLVPRPDLAVEHRMYVPLMGIIALVVIGGEWLRARMAPGGRLALAGLMIAAVSAYAIATIQRNQDYHSALGMWEQVARERPGNPRAHVNAAAMLAAAGRAPEALVHYERALALKADYPEAHNSYGNALADLGRTGEAIAQYRIAIRLCPTYADALNNLGTALFDQH